MSDTTTPTAESFRFRVHRHLTEHPRLTAYEVGRALGSNQGTAARELARMEADGLVTHRLARRASTDTRPRVQWTALPVAEPRSLTADVALCANSSHFQRTKAVARLSFPDGRYNPTTACSGCLDQQVRQARLEVYPIRIDPIGDPS